MTNNFTRLDGALISRISSKKLSSKWSRISPTYSLSTVAKPYAIWKSTLETTGRSRMQCWGCRSLTLKVYPTETKSALWSREQNNSYSSKQNNWYRGDYLWPSQLIIQWMPPCTSSRILSNHSSPHCQLRQLLTDRPSSIEDVRPKKSLFLRLCLCLASQSILRATLISSLRRLAQNLSNSMIGNIVDFWKNRSTDNAWTTPNCIRLAGMLPILHTKAKKVKFNQRPTINYKSCRRSLSTLLQ
jgi:hypothetical protein